MFQQGMSIFIRSVQGFSQPQAVKYAGKFIISESLNPSFSDENGKTKV